MWVEIYTHHVAISVNSVNLILLFIFNYREIWSRFLAFESEVGDLACIQKVEKRRAQAIEKVVH